MAGLPGSGLGGIFYILLVIWMFVRRACGGGRAPDQWKQMMPLAYMSVAIVAVLAITSAMMAWVVGRLPTVADIVASSGAAGRWAMILGAMPLLSIAVLLCALQVARLVVPRTGV